MKKTLTTFIICILSAIILSGCSSTRKATKSDYNLSQEATITAQETTTIENTETTTGQTNISEAIAGSVEFTRVEFTDGTTIYDVFPNWQDSPSTPPNIKRTEPPDTEKPVPGVKSITTGRLDFNKNTETQAETTTQKDSQEQTSLDTKIDTTSEVSQHETTTEKEKRGFFYWLGVIGTIAAGIGILFLMYKFFGKMHEWKHRGEI